MEPYVALSIFEVHFASQPACSCCQFQNRFNESVTADQYRILAEAGCLSPRLHNSVVIDPCHIVSHGLQENQSRDLQGLLPISILSSFVLGVLTVAHTMAIGWLWQLAFFFCALVRTTRPYPCCPRRPGCKRPAYHRELKNYKCDVSIFLT